jgi:hypothetical protein
VHGSKATAFGGGSLLVQQMITASPAMPAMQVRQASQVFRQSATQMRPDLWDLRDPALLNRTGEPACTIRLYEEETSLE